MPSPQPNSARDDWDDHWSRFSQATQFNPAQDFRREIILQMLRDGAPLRGGRVLDVGCGPGELAAQLAPLLEGGTLLGVDAAATAVRLAQARCPQFTFLAADVLHADALPGGYRSWATHAICSEVLEHLDAPEQLLQNLGGWLQDHGLLVVTVPSGPMSAFDRHIGHRRHYTAQTLRQSLERSGYRVLALHRAGFPFFNLYRLGVMLVGERLVRSPPTMASGGLGLAPKLALVGCRYGFRASRTDSRLGWQLVAAAQWLGGKGLATPPPYGRLKNLPRC